MEGSVRIAVDIGGTFTDIQILEESSGSAFAHKTPTTPDNPANGLIQGIRDASQRFDFSFAQVGALMHGTTIATNAVLERRFPKAALLTTRGFEDVLEIGRHVRREIYSQIAESRTLLVPRRHRFGINERITAKGRVEQPLDEPQVIEQIDAIRAEGITVVAVCCLHSFTNSIHEQRIGALIRERIPEAHVSLSSAISPEAREYERTATTVLNALLMPIVGEYLTRLTSRLRAEGMHAPVYLVQSNGGVTTPDIAAEQPARLLLSGPSGGARAVEVIAERLAAPDLIAIDMGGTSFDVSVIQNGAARLRTQGDVDHLPVRLPMLEIRTIGAGGGSLAGVDTTGRLFVGPKSAGAEPGPVAYCRGGVQPTVTDANIALGRIDPNYFLGGEMAIDAAAAREAISAKIAAVLGMTTEHAANGIIEIAVTHMAAAIRVSLFEKGLDPKDFALVSFGGAGGLHAALVADELNISRVVYPPDAGTQSAWGMLFANIVQDTARSSLCVADDTSISNLDATAVELGGRGEQLLNRAGVSAERQRYTLSFDMRYPGQGWEINVPVTSTTIDRDTLHTVAAEFHRTHQEQFAHSDPQVVPEVVTLRLRAEGIVDKPKPMQFTPLGAGRERGTRDIFINAGWRAVDIIDRDEMDVGDVVYGPAIIEQHHATIFVPPSWRIAMDASGVLIADAE